MKKIFLSLICFVLLSVSSPTSAQDSNIDFCVALSELAGSIMDGRQSNVLMSEMVKAMGNQKDHPLYPLTLELIIKAYDSEGYSSDEYREKAKIDFSNEIFSACIKATSSQL